MLIHDGIVRARYRDSFEREELMEPGTVYRFDVDFWATANRFEAGHRIRLDISSSNFPSFGVNPNTGEPIGRHTHTVVALNSVYHDAEHQSHLLLPVHRG
jgi:putative CocE/NonD family hydrolase